MLTGLSDIASLEGIQWLNRYDLELDPKLIALCEAINLKINEIS